MSTDSLPARAGRIHKALRKLFPDAPCALSYSSPLELLVATVLSAQCTDIRVNIVTKELFRRYRTAQDYAAAPLEEIEDVIRSTGFFRSKARAIQGLASAITVDHAGEVPRSMDDLVRLPGVGRKTANVVLGEAFGITSGVVVDTHVKRIAGRLGLTASADPEQIERDLMALFPKKDWQKLSMRLILHGRDLCPARKPRCGECPLLEECPFGAREVRAARAAPEGSPAMKGRRLTRRAPTG
jgi:endonuclease-3